MQRRGSRMALVWRGAVVGVVALLVLIFAINVTLP
jgi:hypothetical protein